MDRLCGLVATDPEVPGSIPGVTTQPHEYNWGATWMKKYRFGQENRINGRGDPLRWPRDTLYPKKLALTTPTSGGRSVGIVRLRTKGHGVFSFSSFCLMF
jgi:hypothetical protein